MAYFDYICDKCGTSFEICRGINEDRGDVVCPKCGDGEVRRNFGSVYLPRKAGSGGAGGGKCDTCTGGDCGSCG